MFETQGRKVELTATGRLLYRRAKLLLDETGELYLVLADRDAAGPGVLRLAEIIREEAARNCAERGGNAQ